MPQEVETQNLATREEWQKLLKDCEELVRKYEALAENNRQLKERTEDLERGVAEIEGRWNQILGVPFDGVPHEKVSALEQRIVEGLKALPDEDLPDCEWAFWGWLFSFLTADEIELMRAMQAASSPRECDNWLKCVMQDSGRFMIMEFRYKRLERKRR